MIRERWEQQGAVLINLTESERAMKTNLNDLMRAKELLELDKSYLSRELNVMSRKYEEASRQTDDLKVDARTAELKVGLFLI